MSAAVCFGSGSPKEIKLIVTLWRYFHEDLAARLVENQIYSTFSRDRAGGNRFHGNNAPRSISNTRDAYIFASRSENPDLSTSTYIKFDVFRLLTENGYKQQQERAARATH